MTLIQSFGSIDPPLPFPVAVIPNWIDPNELALSDADRENSRNEFGLKHEYPAIGVINQIGEAKGQATLLRAAAQLRDRKDLQILIAGREHAPTERYTKYLRRLAEELGLAERTVFAGHVTRLPQLLASLDLVAIPSENEAFSIVCLEAMSARRPVIASAVGGLAEIIEDGKTGLLFPAGDARVLADRIEQALGSPALCRMLTEAAYRSVESRFSRAAQIEKIEKLYAGAIERRTK